MTASGESTLPQRQQNLHQLTELGAVLVLSVSALGSSYAGFQESLWDGDQAAHYAMAMTNQTAASKEEMLAVQLNSVNALQFTQWLNAYAAGNLELEAFYRDRFQPEFRSAFDKWIASRPRFDARSPPTPFDVPGYREQSRSRAQQLAQRAERDLRAAAHDAGISDSYRQSAVIFALALFLGGIVQGFDAQRLRLILVSLGTIATLIALLELAGLPAMRLY
jgi:hypothetical protein